MMTATQIQLVPVPHRIPCEYLNGHVWVAAPGEDMLGNKIRLEVCAGCGAVKR